MSVRTSVGRRAEDGFALTELAVVVIIMGILATIAISTYYAQRHKAENVSAISTLKTLRTVAESIRADSQPAVYSGDLTAYEDEQRSYQYYGQDVASDNANEVSVDAPDDGHWVSFAVSSGQRCYYMRLDIGADQVFKDNRAVDGSTVVCKATEFEDGAGSGWG